MKSKLAGLVLALAALANLEAQSVIQATQATALASASITSITSKSGTLLKIIVGTPIAAATLKVWDLSAANCTGSPSNPLYTITIPAAAGNPFELTPNVQITNGVCAIASSASMLITFQTN